MRNVLFMFLLFTLGIGFDRPSFADNTVSVEGLAGLRAFRDAEQLSYNSRDLDGLLDLFTEDIMVGSIGQPILSGRDALRDFFPQFWAGFDVIEITEVVDDDVVESGAILTVWAHFTIRMIAKGETEVRMVGGRILCIFKRGDDGKYRLWREAGLDAAPE